MKFSPESGHKGVCCFILFALIIAMFAIVEDLERKASFKDENEADVIRQKLERLVNNILAEVEKRDKRFQNSLILSGSVYEGVKVHQPDEFDFMVRINSLTNKPLFYPCDKGEGYVKLALEEDEWKEFKDEQGFFSPKRLCQHFKKLVNESLSDAEIPEGLSIKRAAPDLLEGPWGPVYSNVLANSSSQDNPSDLMYSEVHGPATTLYITWEGGSTYQNLLISVDLTLALEYVKSKLPVQLSKLPQSIDDFLQRSGFHVVPAGFDIWRISFSMAEKEILCFSPEGFKACYRVLKIMRDSIAESLRLDPSLVPSYVFKTVLLSQLFTAGEDSWKKEHRAQNIDHVLEITLQGIIREEIYSFFLPRYNLLSVADHENKLRQCILEDMLNRLRGLEMKHKSEDVKETKRQVRVLEMVDLLEFICSCALDRKDPAALLNKMFDNIGNIPGSRKFGWFWNQFTDLNSTELDEDAYSFLIQIWSLVDNCFRKLLVSLQGELNLLAQKLYIRICDKKKEFELKHQVMHTSAIKQMSLHQMVRELFEDLAESYVNEENSTWSNLHKAVPPGYRASRLLQDVSDVTLNAGSDNGLAMFKQRIGQYLAWIPEPYLMSLAISYVGQLFYQAEDTLRRKLDYITLPELDLD